MPTRLNEIIYVSYTVDRLPSLAHNKASMRVTSSIQTHDSIWIALANALEEASRESNATPELILLFLSGSESDALTDEVLKQIRTKFSNAKIFGGVTDALIGTGREFEGRTCASVMMVSELGGEPRIVPLECAKTPDGWSVLGIDDDVHHDANACGGMLVLACPKSFSAEMLYDSLEASAPLGQPPVPIFGGNLSHSQWEQPTTLFCEDRIVREGAIGLIMPSTVRWSTLVSQGCRPIGEPMIVTEMRDRKIVSLGGKPALDRLRDMFHELPNRERELAMRLLLIGRAVSEYSETFSHGEFLIRNIVSIDQEDRSIEVADRFKVGQTVRFHLLDAEAADADLRHLMARAKHSGLAPKAGLLFTCNGRGKRMFGSPNHDAGIVDEYFAGVPVAGFFAAGEFGPVANCNLVHGFTAVAAFLTETS